MISPDGNCDEPLTSSTTEFSANIMSNRSRAAIYRSIIWIRRERTRKKRRLRIIREKREGRTLYITSGNDEESRRNDHENFATKSAILCSFIGSEQRKRKKRQKIKKIAPNRLCLVSPRNGRRSRAREIILNIFAGFYSPDSPLLIHSIVVLFRTFARRIHPVLLHEQLRGDEQMSRSAHLSTRCVTRC